MSFIADAARARHHRRVAGRPRGRGLTRADAFVIQSDKRDRSRRRSSSQRRRSIRASAGTRGGRAGRPRRVRHAHAVVELLGDRAGRRHANSRRGRGSGGAGGQLFLCAPGPYTPPGGRLPRTTTEAGPTSELQIAGSGGRARRSGQPRQRTSFTHWRARQTRADQYDDEQTSTWCSRGCGGLEARRGCHRHRPAVHPFLDVARQLRHLQVIVIGCAAG